jgi:hypothetical protein
LEKFGPALYIGELGEEKPIADNSAGEMDASSFGDLLPFGDPMWYADFQSPYYSESHRKVRAVMREFVDKEITPYCFEWDEVSLPFIVAYLKPSI